MSEIRALIVDDSSVMRKIVERSLRQAGLDLKEVHEAGSGSVTTGDSFAGKCTFLLEYAFNAGLPG